MNPSNGETQGYHIFLIPATEVATVIRDCIEMLAKKYGGPVFEPHLTLLPPTTHSEAELLRLTESVATHSAPELTPIEVRTGSVFFKCCYLAIENTAALQEIARDLRAATGSDTPFDPHISLAYGEFSEDMLTRMKSDAEAFFAAHPLPTAPASEIRLLKTEGEVHNWVPVATYPF